MKDVLEFYASQWVVNSDGNPDVPGGMRSWQEPTDELWADAGHKAQEALQDLGEAPQQTFLIWSEEHNAWWRPDSAGYTTSMRQAGRYSKAEAQRIVEGANYGLAFNEAMVPVTPAMGEAMALKGRGR